MNHKQMVQKFSELENRIRVLELEREVLQLKLRGAPMIAQPAAPQPPWTITSQQDPRYKSESLL